MVQSSTYRRQPHSSHYEKNEDLFQYSHSCCPHCFIQGETARYCAFRQGIKQKTLLNALPEQIHSCPSYAGLPYWPYIFNMFAFPKDMMSSYLTNEARSERLANLTWTLLPIHFLFHSCCGMRLAQRWYLSSLKLLNLFRSQKHQHFFFNASHVRKVNKLINTTLVTQLNTNKNKRCAAVVFTEVNPPVLTKLCIASLVDSYCKTSQRQD